MISLLNCSNGMKTGCPNLSLNYKKFPKLKMGMSFYIFRYKPVDSFIKSPFDIHGPFIKNDMGVNLILEIEFQYENNSYQVMRNGQLCDHESIDLLLLNKIRYRKKENESKLFLEYEHGDGDVFCKSKHEMNEMFVIDYSKYKTFRGKYLPNSF